MNLERPICFFDIEATGADPASDRIVSLSVLKITPSDLFNGEPTEEWLEGLFNPGFEMSQEVIGIHGITNERVKDAPRFYDHAAKFLEFIKGCDLGGFNLYNFDVPILWEEFHRADIEWSLEGIHIVDVGNIFKIKETRTLSAAVKFYCGREHEGAHNARSDVQATYDVLIGQRGRYDDLGCMNVAGMSDFSKMDKRADLAGKILIDEDGDYVYGLKSRRGVKVKDDPGFAEWMLSKDFTAQTKMVIRRILLELEPQSEFFPEEDHE